MQHLFFWHHFPLHHIWRSPPRIFPPSRPFTPLCHHPGKGSCMGLLNTAQSVCTRYTSCCTSFKSIIIIFLTEFAISNVACTYICLPKETMPCCRVARDRDTCYATRGTVYVVPIASHSPVLKTDRAERDPSCTGCGNRRLTRRWLLLERFSARVSDLPASCNARLFSVFRSALLPLHR